jgi:Ca2+/Na+ antiporter
MLNTITNIIEYNVMIVLSVFLLVALVIGKVEIITSILIFCMWFVFGFLSFTRGYSMKITEEMEEIYRQKVAEEYNKKQNEISNN